MKPHAHGTPTTSKHLPQQHTYHSNTRTRPEQAQCVHAPSLLFECALDVSSLVECMLNPTQDDAAKH